MSLAGSSRRRLPRRLTLFATLLALLAPAGGRPGARAQSPAPPQVTVNLYGSSLSFRTLPSTLVTAELAGPTGRKAEGVGVGDAQGMAQVGFYTGQTSILPGDSIVLSRANDKPLHLTVPQLAASLVDLPTVEGVAPPGATAQLSLVVQGQSPTAIEKQVVADSQGSFSVDLGAQFGDPDAVATGTLTYDSPEGGRFVLTLATVDAQITLGAPALRGRATAGWEISATVTAAGGSPQKIGPVTAGGDGGFVLPLQALGRPIAVGDDVDLSASGDAGNTTWSAIYLNQVKDITVVLDRSSDRATGTAPAGGAVILSAEDMDGRQELFRATADGAGAPPIPARATSAWAAWPCCRGCAWASICPSARAWPNPAGSSPSPCAAPPAPSRPRAPPRLMTRAATSSTSSARREQSPRPATAWRSRLPTTSAIPCCCAYPS